MIRPAPPRPFDCCISTAPSDNCRSVVGGGHDVIVFDVGRFGLLEHQPTVNSLPDGTAPFAFTFDDASRGVLTHAGTSALATYELADDGAMTLVSEVPNGQMAACWVVAAGGRYYVSNTGTSTLSIYDADDVGAWPCRLLRSPPVQERSTAR